MNGRKVYGVPCSKKCGRFVPTSKSTGKATRIGGKRGELIQPKLNATCSYCLGKKPPVAL